MSVRLSGTSRRPGQKRVIEKLWRKFFANPWQWWDNRTEKVNSKYPDFKHKETQEGLWVDGKSNPPWVQAELAAMAPRIVQAHLFSWNKRLSRYVKEGYPERTLELFHHMLREGMNPDTFSFVAVLNACARVRALEEGRRIHAQIIQSGCESHVYVGTCLIDMYAKCQSIDNAWGVFNKMCTRHIVPWNAMIQGCVKCGQAQRALDLSRRMEHERIKPDIVTFIGLVNACASVGELKKGKQVHEQIIQRSFESDVSVGNSLVDMYAKCGSMEDAWRVFTKMPVRDVVSWSAMILGYVNCGQGQQALELSQQMEQEGVEPNRVTFIGLLNACASISAVDQGKHVHKQIIQSGCESDVFVGSSLIDMYAKCGDIEDAWRVFNTMLTHDVFAWTAMLGAYAMHGHAKEALAHFERMCHSGVEMNKVTFVSLLSACSHAGLVDEAFHYFKCMTGVYNISPMVDHYACMVDLLGRAGRLHEIEYLIKAMSCEPDAVVWMSLIGACRFHGNVEMEKRYCKVCRDTVQSG